MKQFTISRAERLKSEKTISSLFKSGKSLGGSYPLRLVWSEVENPFIKDFQIQFTVSVPKKRYKTAVARNTLKRRVREAFRVYKSQIYDKIQNNGKFYALMIIYTGNEAADYSTIEQSTKKMIRKFLEQVG